MLDDVPRRLTDAQRGDLVVLAREVNSQLCRLVGRDPADVVGRRTEELTHPDDVGTVLAARRRRVEALAVTVARADAALHEAKRGGRGRVVVRVPRTR